MFRADKLALRLNRVRPISSQQKDDRRWQNIQFKNWNVELETLLDRESFYIVLFKLKLQNCLSV